MNHFQRRRAVLKEYAKEANIDLIILPAYRRQQRANDTVYPFRQDSSFYYLTGVIEPDVLYVYSVTYDEEWLIEPHRSQQEIDFEGVIDRTSWEASGITDIMLERAGWQRLDMLIKQASLVGVFQPNRDRRMSANNAHDRLIQQIRRRKRGLRLHDLTVQVARQRALKDEFEIAAIQEAIDVTTTVLRDIYSNLSSFTSEHAIEAAITGGFRSRQAQHAYEPIVASGPRALTMHYVANNQALQAGELLLMDVGAEVNLYAADITRTIPVSGRFTARQEEVYQAVLEMQTSAIALIQPDQSTLEYVEHTSHQLIEILKNLGLPHQQPHRYMPHAISHGLGLDVHDPVGHDRFKTGMVITVEPGIYIPEEGIGVRIEDDIHVTADGAVNMSQALPASVAELHQSLQ
jgi:Xaa-Pro aminopeptidase